MYGKTIPRSLVGLITLLILLPEFGLAKANDWKSEILSWEKKIKDTKSFSLKRQKLESLEKSLKLMKDSKDPMPETERIEINTVLSLMEEFSGKSKLKRKECQAKLLDVRNRYEPSTSISLKPKSAGLVAFEGLLVAFYGCR